MIADLVSHLIGLVEEFFKKDESWWLLALIMAGGAVGVGIPSNLSFDLIAFLIQFFLLTWWLWLFLILLPIFESLWLFWRQELFKKTLSFVLLELRVPREVDKSPKAMEQFFSAIHVLRNAPGDFKGKYLDGEVSVPFSLEIVSLGGEVHFYIRTLKKNRNFVEAALFSYYKDVEIEEVTDYAENMPKNFLEARKENKEIFGTEIILSKEDAYPIKTYPEFESEAEEKQFDPISNFLEVLGKIKKEEFVGIQIIADPASNDWKDKWEPFLEKLKTPKMMEVKSKGSGEEPDSVRNVPMSRSPGQADVLEEVEKNLSKPAFVNLIRILYISPVENFQSSFGKGIMGPFNQYNALNMNSFKPNPKVRTFVSPLQWPHVSSSVRTDYRKERYIYNFKRRELPPEPWMGKIMTSFLHNLNFGSKRFVLNIEGLATLFHLPTLTVLTAPHIKRIESRKSGPSAGLGIYGDEEEISRFMK